VSILFFIHLSGLGLTEKKIPREGGEEMLRRGGMLLAQII